MSLIEREKLIDHLNACLAESDGGTPITDAVIVAIRCAVEQMPEVDAVPVVHREWIETPYDYNKPTPSARFSCSNCGRRTGYRQSKTFNYCPNCGAKMDGGKDDRERKADGTA